jgi:hypothetical protein
VTLEPVVAGETETLNIEIFPTDAVIEPGHRLRLALTHGDVPHMLAATPDALNSIGAVDSVHIDPAQPSFLTLPVAGAGTSSGLPLALRSSCKTVVARIALRRRRHDRIVAATVFVGGRRQTVRGHDLRSVVVRLGAATTHVRIVERTAHGRRVTLRRTLRAKHCS